MLGQQKTGIERYWKNLTQYLLNSKNEIVLYSNLPKNAINIYYNELDSLNVYTPLSKNGLYRILYGFNDSIKKIKPDLIHVSYFTPFIKTVPVVTTIHDVCFKKVPATFSAKSLFAFWFFLKRSLSLSDAIICVSNTTKRGLLKYYPVDPSKVFVIYEAADLIFQYIRNRRLVKKTIKEKFNIKTNYFLVVGNIDERKNPFLIIKAFKYLLKIKPNIQLVFVGPNKMRIDLLPEIKKMWNDNKLKILNYVADKDLVLLYNGASALIYNSFAEGFGLPLVEAMNCKTPIICNNINPLIEIARDSALFVNGEVDLYNAMKKIAFDNISYNKYSFLAYRRRKLFSWDKTAEETLRVYNYVLKK